MALGSENMVYHQQPTQYHQQQPKLQQFNTHQQREVLRTRNVNHQRSIAPAPYTKPSSHTLMLDGTTLDSNNPSVIRRNARERSRVKQVNDGFSTLRKHIPTSIVAEISNGRRGIGPGADKKLSKVDTLRMAAEYIRRLKNLIDEVDNSDASSISTYPTSPSSITSSSYASSTSGSPPPPSSQYSNNNNYYHPTSSSSELPQHSTQLQYCPTLSYVGTFHQHQLISPANSCSSAESYQNHSPNHYQSLSTFALNTPNTTPIKFEPASNFDDYHQQHHHHNTTSSSNTDDEELLDYISLWQDQ